MVLQARFTEIKKYLVVFASAIFVASIFVAASAYSQETTKVSAGDIVRSGLNETAGKKGAELEISGGGATLPVLIGRGIAALLSLIAVLFFILTIYAGIMWMLARGNEEMTKKAKNTIVAAVAGIIVVMGSYAITQFVLNSVQSTVKPDAPGSGRAPGAGGQVCCAISVGDPAAGGRATTYRAVTNIAECTRACSRGGVANIGAPTCTIDPSRNPPAC